MFDTRKLSETFETALTMPRDSKASLADQEHALRVAEIQTQIAIAEQLFRIADVMAWYRFGKHQTKPMSLLQRTRALQDEMALNDSIERGEAA